ncbi:MAG: hypothetical protein N4A74_01545 [Carboxylicivirga sp.]|jgi:hypothetical protein|nr:hypothetical protein [Carboxylicivirga sp.]
MIQRLFRLILLLTIIFTASCDSSKFKETPIDTFIGHWELHGRQMFDGMEVEIKKNESGQIVGTVKTLNQNKYVKMFVEINDTWISGIKRASNYKFKLTEKKIGSALFALYGQSSSKDYSVEFIDENTFGLATGNSDPIESTIIYKRKTPANNGL